MFLILEYAVSLVLFETDLHELEIKKLVEKISSFLFLIDMNVMT